MDHLKSEVIIKTFFNCSNIPSQALETKIIPTYDADVKTGFRELCIRLKRCPKGEEAAQEDLKRLYHTGTRRNEA